MGVILVQVLFRLPYCCSIIGVASLSFLEDTISHQLSWSSGLLLMAASTLCRCQCREILKVEVDFSYALSSLQDLRAKMEVRESTPVEDPSPGTLQSSGIHSGCKSKS